MRPIEKSIFKMVKVQPQNIRNAIFPIIILNWLTGFSIIEYPINKSRPILSFIYVSLCLLIYISAYFKDFHSNYKDNNQIRKDIFLYLKLYSSIISSCCMIIGWYNYKAWKIIQQRIIMMDENFIKLGILPKYRKIFINLLWQIILWITLVFTLIVFSFYALLQILGWAEVTQLVLTLHYPIHINAVVDFTFTAIIRCLGMRFNGINSLLWKTVMKARKEQNTISFQAALKEIKEKKRIKFCIFKSLHKELTDISFEVNRIYEIQILILIATFFAVMTGFYYISFAGLFFKNVDVHNHWTSKISGLLWCISYTYRFYNITVTCAKVSCEAKKTKEILLELINVTDDEELKFEIEQFSLQITQCPLVFSAFGIFNLDYSFVEKFIGQVLMYTVILIQFSPDVQNLL